MPANIPYTSSEHGDAASFHDSIESPLMSFARRHNHTSAYRNALGRWQTSDPAAESVGADAAAGSSPYCYGASPYDPRSPLYATKGLSNGSPSAAAAAASPISANSSNSRAEIRRQLAEELNFVDKQRELERLQAAIDAEQHNLANRRVSLKDREASLLDAQRALEAQQKALQLELAAFDAEQLRAAEEQRRLDAAAESLHAKQREVDEDIRRRRDNKSQSHKEAQRYVSAAAGEDPFGALNEALRVGASMGVLRAIVEIHIGGVGVPNAKYNAWTPLHYAAWHGHDSLCELLVANGAAVNERDTYSNYTPLDWALSRHHDLAARYLATVGARRGVALAKDEAASSGVSPLQYQSQQRQQQQQQQFGATPASASPSAASRDSPTGVYQF